MSAHEVTIVLDAGLHAWAVDAAAKANTSVEGLVATLVAEERSRRGLESMAAWVREDEDGPTTEEIDLVRAQMLGETEARK